jgi:glycosyltransferase involved in cell wall biosynthesis
MASGLHVVCSEVGAVPTMVTEKGSEGQVARITDKEGHFLLDASQRLADAAVPLLVDAALRKRMDAAARKRAETHFSEQKLAERLASVFKNALGQTPGRAGL